MFFLTGTGVNLMKLHFWPKSFRRNFHRQILDKFAPNSNICLHIHITEYQKKLALSNPSRQLPAAPNQGANQGRQMVCF
jgi:hypothetical protein